VQAWVLNINDGLEVRSFCLIHVQAGYDSLPAGLVRKISENWLKNDQIFGCNGIPKRVENFLRYHERNEFAEKVRKSKS
jgi:hypothetical protein